MPLDDIDNLTDMVSRAVEASTFVAYAESRVKAGRAIRDDSIRRLRQGGMTVPAIATAVGWSEATVKQVIR